MNRYLIEAKISTELRDHEWIEYSLAFNTIFEKDFSVDYFKNKYYGSSFGYSAHGILYFNNSIVGMFTVIPRTYVLNNSDISIGLGCDAFILKEHRKDEYFLKTMSDKVIDLLSKQGVRFFISIPNKTAYPYWKYYAGWRDIGKLNYYITPIRLSRLLNKSWFPDWLSFAFFRLFISVSSHVFPFSSKHNRNRIDLRRDKDFYSQRFSGDYRIRINKNYEGFVYRIMNEDQVRTAYLIDCFPLSQKNIARAINQIIKESGKEIDIVMFVGKVEKPPFFLLKVPKNKEPRVQPLIGYSLEENTDFYSFESWNLSLANFDNR